MPKLLSNQKGALQIFFLAIILVGIVGGIYLVSQTQVFRSKASSGITIQFVDDNGQDITSTASPTVKLKFSDPGGWGTQSFNFVNAANAQSSPGVLRVDLSNASADGNHVAWADKGTQAQTFKPNTTYTFSFSYRSNVVWEFRNRDAGVLTLNPNDSPNFKNMSETKKIETDINGASCDNYGGDDKCHLLIHMYGNGYLEIKDISVTGVNDKGNQTILISPSPDWTGWTTCLSDWGGTCSTGGQPVVPGSTTPPAVGAGEVVSVVIVAEDPNFSTNMKHFSVDDFKTKAMSYTFSSTTPGIKTLYSKFVSSAGKEKQGFPYPATIELVAGPKVPEVGGNINDPKTLLSSSIDNFKATCEWPKVKLTWNAPANADSNTEYQIVYNADIIAKTKDTNYEFIIEKDVINRGVDVVTTIGTTRFGASGGIYCPKFEPPVNISKSKTTYLCAITDQYIVANSGSATTKISAGNTFTFVATFKVTGYSSSDNAILHYASLWDVRDRVNVNPTCRVKGVDKAGNSSTWTCSWDNITAGTKGPHNLYFYLRDYQDSTEVTACSRNQAIPGLVSSYESI